MSEFSLILVEIMLNVDDNYIFQLLSDSMYFAKI